jgi:DNA-directed RNA polymerase sigma subunit (sigma70/sigma32)
MSYSDLLKCLYGRVVPAIDEEALVKKLPELLITTCPVCTGDYLAKIIIWRFGLLGTERQTLQKVALKLGVSGENVRQKEVFALQTLKRALQIECGKTKYQGYALRLHEHLEKLRRK